MIETCRLKNVVIFIQTVLSFVQSRKIMNIAKLLVHNALTDEIVATNFQLLFG